MGCRIAIAQHKICMYSYGAYLVVYSPKQRPASSGLEMHAYALIFQHNIPQLAYNYKGHDKSYFIQSLPAITILSLPMLINLQMQELQVVFSWDIILGNQTLLPQRKKNLII